MNSQEQQDIESLYRFIHGCTRVEEITHLANFLSLRREREPGNWVFRGGEVYASIYRAFLSAASGTKEQFIEADKAIQADLTAAYGTIDDLIAATSAHQLIVGEKILPTVYPHIDYAGDKDHLLVNITPALDSFIHKDTSFRKRASEVGNYQTKRIKNPDPTKHIVQRLVPAYPVQEYRESFWAADIEDIYLKYAQVKDYLDMILKDYYQRPLTGN